MICTISSDKDISVVFFCEECHHGDDMQPACNKDARFFKYCAFPAAEPPVLLPLLHQHQ
jgi:hypothetical protein